MARKKPESEARTMKKALRGVPGFGRGRSGHPSASDDPLKKLREKDDRREASGMPRKHTKREP